MATCKQSYSSYARGCRCTDCTSAWSDYYRARRAAGARTRYTPTCPTCGVTRTSTSRKSSTCYPCAMNARFPRARPKRELVHIPRSSVCWLHDQHPVMRRAAQPKPRLFVAGACAWCGTAFAVLYQKQARFCSDRCVKANNNAKRGRFRVSPVVRLAIYERDEWICQLCFDPVDRSLPPSDMWAASLDHIECQSWTLVPDHSPENLRLAHRWCNSVRGDESYYTVADLAA